MQTLLYGSYATTEAKEYKAEGSHPLGWNQTEAVNTMMENGLSARDAIQAVKDSAAAAKLQEEGKRSDLMAMKRKALKR
jgi:hypothetical protein